MQIGDPWDGIFYPTLTIMMDCFNMVSKRIQELLVAFFFKYKNAVFNGVQEKESIICVRVG